MSFTEHEKIKILTVLNLVEQQLTRDKELGERVARIEAQTANLNCKSHSKDISALKVADEKVKTHIATTRFTFATSLITTAIAIITLTIAIIKL